MSHKTVTATLAERAQLYGSYNRVSRIAQSLKRELRNGLSWYALTDAQREALEMISNKLARIVNGQPGYVDSWHDIAGYAQLVVDEMTLPSLAELDDPQG